VARCPRSLSRGLVCERGVSETRIRDAAVQGAREGRRGCRWQETRVGRLEVESAQYRLLSELGCPGDAGVAGHEVGWGAFEEACGVEGVGAGPEKSGCGV
jgi:hypothetical protein